jgi:hypothetical protein
LGLSAVSPGIVNAPPCVYHHTPGIKRLLVAMYAS